MQYLIEKNAIFSQVWQDYLSSVFVKHDDPVHNLILVFLIKLEKIVLYSVLSKSVFVSYYFNWLTRFARVIEIGCFISIFFSEYHVWYHDGYKMILNPFSYVMKHVD